MNIRATIVTTLVILGATLVAAPAGALQSAGSGWYWQSPVPQGHVLNDVAFGDAQNAWAVGGGGTIMHSTDAGVTWLAQSAPTAEPLGSVHFSDATHGWAVGGSNWDSDMTGDAFTGVILGTEDGGTTWTSQLQLSDKAVADVAFVSAQQGWAVGSRGLILHTTDGGQTWAPQTSGVPRNLMSVVFVDAQHGYVGGADGIVLSTSDGGLTWTRLKAAERAVDWVDVSSLAADGNGTIWAGLGSHTMTGTFPRLARSSNGGRTWRQVDVGWDYDVWHVAAFGQRILAAGPLAGDSVGVTAGGASRVLMSADGGATWSSHIVGPGVTLNSVAFDGAGGACAVGDLIATSADGGATWSGRSTRAITGGSLDFVSPTEGWTTGAGSGSSILAALLAMGRSAPNGTVFHTADGVRWDEQLSVSNRVLVDLDFADALNGWVVGDRGAIRHTIDGGSTWVAQSARTSALLATVAAPSADSAWILGYDLRARSAAALFLLLHSGDAGATWAKVALQKTDIPLAMSWVTPDDGWLLCGTLAAKTLTWTVLRTNDAGHTWTRQPLGGLLGRDTLPLAVEFVDDQHGWLLAMDQVGTSILATSDGGASWTRVASPSAFGNDLMMSLSFVDALEGWASGDALYHTSDGGLSWSREVAGLDQLVSVSGFDATHAWAGGSGGILSTVDAAGDTAPPVTFSDIAGGWSRTSVEAQLTASDVGSAGLAATVYRIDGGPWTPGLTPSVFAAPADHSGDGTHVLEFHSTDAAGNAEPVQMQRVKIDTVRPVIRLRTSVVGRDGVLRIPVRIDDRSCPSVDEFDVSIKTLGGRTLAGMSWQGSTLRTNRWTTLRDARSGDLLPVGTYRISLYAKDRAGNRPARVDTALLIVKPHKIRWPRRTARAVAALPSARGMRVLSRADSLRGQLAALLQRLEGGRL
jgi:photosystem II stability/assembly factor-like uncharacterized protein